MLPEILTLTVVPCCIPSCIQILKGLKSQRKKKTTTEESVLTVLGYLSTNYTFLNSLSSDKMKQCLHFLHDLSMFIILL